MSAIALDLMRRRRSLPPQGMKGPGPTPDELTSLLQIASRVPDHGKLAPWRFLILQGEARARAGRIAADRLAAKEGALDPQRRALEEARFARAPLVVGVISRAAPHLKIPEWEQILSAGAVCMTLCHAAHAMGFVSAWLTEWCAYDADFCVKLGLAAHEKFAGFIHIGRPDMVSEDRPRPALADIVEYFAPA